MRAQVRRPVPCGRPDLLDGVGSIEPVDVNFTFGRLSATLTAPPDFDATFLQLPYCEEGECDSELSVHIEPGAAPFDALGRARMNGPDCIEVGFPRWIAAVERHKASVKMATADRTDLQFCYSVLASVGVAWTMLRGGLALHASAVEVGNGEAYLFSGRSGAGKSTVAALLADGAPLADDRTLLWKTGDGFEVESAPNTHRGVAQVKRIFFLGRGRTTRFVKLRRAAATAELLRHVIVWDADGPLYDTVLSRVTEVTGSVECFSLDVSLDDVSLDFLGLPGER